MKKTIRLNESEFRNMIGEAVKKIINEIGDTPKGQYMLGRLSSKYENNKDYDKNDNLWKYARKQRNRSDAKQFNDWDTLEQTNGKQFVDSFKKANEHDPEGALSNDFASLDNHFNDGYNDQEIRGSGEDYNDSFYKYRQKIRGNVNMPQKKEW